jgi:hypothetical protein
MLVKQRLPPLFLSRIYAFLASPEDLWDDRPLYLSCIVS